jgi:polyvinyl alcohol dehydrogenase (cytochrome)
MFPHMPTRLGQYLFIAVLIISAMFAPTSTGQNGGAPQNVVWTNVANCTVTGNSLQKTAGRSDSSDAGARSQQVVASGDAYFEFTASDSNKVLFCGLTHAAIGTAFSEIDFAIKLTELGIAEVRENNAYGVETTYRVGDVFRVAVQGNVVRYYKNGLSFYASSKTPTYPLFADAAFLTVGGRVANAVVGALAADTSANWTAYQHDSAHTGYSNSSDLNSSNIATLDQAWSFPTGGWVTGTPLVADGTVYVGSWDAKMYALRERDGSQIWSFTADVSSDNCGFTYGIDATAALSDGKLYFGSAGCTLYALDAATGSLIWRTQLEDYSKGFHLWSSPLVTGGKIYVGLASHCDHPCVRGRVVCLNAANGQILWNFYTAPEGSTGAGVWSSFALDESRRMIYATTGNFCQGNDTYGDSFIALNADTGALVWSWKNLARDRDTENLDFGASPVLFDIGSTPALAAGSKDGHCYALNRATGELLWDSTISDGSSTSGTICTPAAAYGMLFMGTSVQSSSGKFVALDQRDGRIVWQGAQPSQVLGAAAVAGGSVLIGGGDGLLRSYDASTGTLLWSSARRGSMLGGVSVSLDHVFVGSIDGALYAFAIPASPPPPTPPPPAAATLTVNSPSAGDQWARGQKYDITWSASSSVSRVDVSISRDGGATWELLAASVDSTAGRLLVKAKKPASDTVVVRVSNSSAPTVFGQSGMFSIR